MHHSLLHLSLIPDIGPATVERFTQQLTLEHLAQLYTYTKKDFQELFSLSERLSGLLVAGLANSQLLEKELNLIERYKIKWTTILSSTYPVMLKTIHLAPTVLYWRGELDPTTDRTIACVGSRNATPYGIESVNFLVPDLVNENWITVSGGALGIDTCVHTKTIQEEGKTYAVLGSGLLRPYPASNNKLFEAIIASGGVVMSSFALQQEPLAGNFPARNRIIAGLSRACVVIQAAEKSGALITARYALEQGREVCAVPGTIFDPLARGCNMLIAQGGTPVLAATDIIQALGYAPQKKEEKSSKRERVISKQEKIRTYCHLPRAFDDIVAHLSSLSEFCSEKDLQDELFALQLEGLIEQNFMGYWQA